MLKCPMCRKTAVRVVSASHAVEADDGVTLNYADELMHCEACGEEYYTHEQALSASRSRAAVLRQHAGLLTPDGIRAVRELYGLTQAQLERILNTGAKTVVRWESGTVCQSRAADQLLQLLAASPTNLWALAARAGVEIPVTVEGSELVQTFAVPEGFQPDVSWVSGFSGGPFPYSTTLVNTAVVGGDTRVATAIAASDDLLPPDLDQAA